MRAVVLEAPRVHEAGAAQQPQPVRARLGGLRGRGGYLRGLARASVAAQPGKHGGRVRRGEDAILAAGDLQQRRGRALADAEAGARLPRRALIAFEAALDLGGERVRAGVAADDVVAEVGDARRALARGEQGVGLGDAVGLRRRHAQALADVAEGARADPADCVLHGVQRWQQQLALLAGPLRAAMCAATRPGLGIRRGRRTEQRIDGGALRRRGGGGETMDFHARQPIFSMRIAEALNSEVPDFGSQASIVRRLVSTSSGKCSVMKASPGRSSEA